MILWDVLERIRTIWEDEAPGATRVVIREIFELGRTQDFEIDRISLEKKDGELIVVIHEK